MPFVRKIMLQHAHPAKLALDSLGVVVAMTLLWQKNLVWALICLFGFSFLGTLVVWGKNEEALAATPLGRFMLGQANPMNLVVRTVGFITLAYGVWAHQFLAMLVGVAVIASGRLWTTPPPSDR